MPIFVRERIHQYLLHLHLHRFCGRHLIEEVDDSLCRIADLMRVRHHCVAASNAFRMHVHHRFAFHDFCE